MVFTSAMLSVLLKYVILFKVGCFKSRRVRAKCSEHFISNFSNKFSKTSPTVVPESYLNDFVCSFSRKTFSTFGIRGRSWSSSVDFKKKHKKLQLKQLCKKYQNFFLILHLWRKHAHMWKHSSYTHLTFFQIKIQCLKRFMLQVYPSSLVTQSFVINGDWNALKMFLQRLFWHSANYLRFLRLREQNLDNVTMLLNSEPCRAVPGRTKAVTSQKSAIIFFTYLIILIVVHRVKQHRQWSSRHSSCNTRWRRWKYVRASTKWSRWADGC